MQAAAARAAARSADESARVDRALRVREESLARRAADASSAHIWARARRALMSASYRRKLKVRALALCVRGRVTRGRSATPPCLPSAAWRACAVQRRPPPLSQRRQQRLRRGRACLQSTSIELPATLPTSRHAKPGSALLR